MTVWKRRLRQTLPACRRSVFCILIASCFLSGCSKKAVETITLGEWISLLVQEAALPKAQADTPYFLTVSTDSPYYSAVQSAVEWNVLRVEEGFKTDRLLTREWTAATLMRLKTTDLKATDDGDIRDLAATRFKTEVCACVHAGLMDVDRRQRFYPQAVMDRGQAQALLADMVRWINTRTFEDDREEIEFTDGQKPIELPDEASIRDDILQSHEKTDFKVGDVVREEEGESFYRIDAPIDDSRWRVSPISDFSMLNELDIETAQELSFDSAWLEEGTTANFPRGPLHKTITRQFGDIQVSYSFDQGGIRIRASREIGSGGRLYGILSLYDFRSAIRVHMQKQTMDTCYMRLDFKTMQSIGIEGKKSTIRYGNQSTFSKNGLQGLLADEAEPFAITLPVTALHIPLPHLPAVTIRLGLRLSVGCDGEMDMTLTQNHTIGAEIRNHGVRPIYQCENTASAGMQANAWLLGGVDTTLLAARMAIADVAYETGAKTSLSATVHTYDEHGTHTQAQIPAANLYKLAAQKDIMLCTDVDAHWVSRMHCNSSSTLAGRLGFATKHDFMKSSEQNRIPQLHGHFENGLRVPHCTRNKDRLPTATFDAADSRAIEPERYSYLIRQGQQIQIGLKRLPEGYTKEDLCYTVQGRSVSVLDDGRIVAKEIGAAIVTIHTRDGRYKAHCNVVVRDSG